MAKRYVGIDLGQRYVKLCLAEEDYWGNLVPVSFLEKKINSFKNGEIVESESFESEVIDFLHNLSEQVGEKVKEISLSFSAPYFIGHQSSGRAIIHGKAVTNDDLERAKRIAKMTILNHNQDVIFESPLYYFLDNNQNKIIDPVGMESRTLEAFIYLIQGLSSALKKIENIFAKNKIKIKEIYPNPIPASYLVLSRKLKESGVVLTDFGYYLTSISVFKEGNLVNFKVFPVGFYNLLQDLAITAKVELDEVENAFEELIRGDQESRRKMKLKLGKKNFNYSNLIKISEKIFSQVFKKSGLEEYFYKIQENYKLPNGCYLFGSISSIAEFRNIFEDIFGMSMKLALPESKDFPENQHIFLNAFGLCHLDQKISAQKHNFILDFLKSLKHFLFSKE